MQNHGEPCKAFACFSLKLLLSVVLKSAIIGVPQLADSGRSAAAMSTCQAED